MTIDINSDLGEGFGAYSIADDERLLELVTSANIACGFHAGDPVHMDRVVGIAKRLGVDLGAHVGYPDLLGFGRRAMNIDPDDLDKYILYQLGALYGIAKPIGHHITHMSPHGALGNLASADQKTADVIVKAGLKFDPHMTFITMSGSAMEIAAQSLGAKTYNIFLADRAYTAGGQLASRALPGAVIHDAALVQKRIERVLKGGTVETMDGGELKVTVQSILVHSDTPGAVEMAEIIRKSVHAAGHETAPLSQL